MSKTWDVVVKLIAGAALTGGLAWGGYLQVQVDDMKSKSAQLSERTAIVETNYQNIITSLARIETNQGRVEAKVDALNQGR